MQKSQTILKNISYICLKIVNLLTLTFCFSLTKNLKVIINIIKSHSKGNNAKTFLRLFFF